MKYSDFSKNEENPFLKNAIEQINKNVVKKYKSSTGTSRAAILHAVNPDTGELLGHTSFIRQIEVDEQQFAKFYLSNFKAFFNLSERSIRVFGYILTKLTVNSDMFIFLFDECMKYTQYKSKKAIYSGLTELIQAEIIAKGKTDILFFINPLVLFNGNRITFAKTYVKRQTEQTNNKKIRSDKDQLSLDLFNDD